MSWRERGGKLCVKMDEFGGETSSYKSFTWLISISISRWRVLMTIPESDLGAEKKGGGKGSRGCPNIVGFGILPGPRITIPKNSTFISTVRRWCLGISRLNRPQHRVVLRQSLKEQNGEVIYEKNRIALLLSRPTTKLLGQRVVLCGVLDVVVVRGSLRITMKRKPRGLSERPRCFTSMYRDIDRGKLTIPKNGTCNL